MCLNTFVIARPSPVGLKTPTSFLANLKRNLTILSRVFNLTQAGDIADSDKYTTKQYRDKAAVSPNSKISLQLVGAKATNVRRGRLYSKYGFLVQMSKDGFVDGTMKYNSPTGR